MADRPAPTDAGCCKEASKQTRHHSQDAIRKTSCMGQDSEYPTTVKRRRWVTFRRPRPSEAVRYRMHAASKEAAQAITLSRSHSKVRAPKRKASCDRAIAGSVIDL